MLELNIGYKNVRYMYFKSTVLISSLTY